MLRSLWFPYFQARSRALRRSYCYSLEDSLAYLLPLQNWQSTHVYMCHTTSLMRTRDLWCNRLGKVSNFTGSNALFSIPSANLRFLTFLALEFWFRASENVKWKLRNVVGFVSLTGWWAVTINESLPFGISLPLPAIIKIPLPALSSPVSRTPPAPCCPGLPPPCPPPLWSLAIVKFWLGY